MRKKWYTTSETIEALRISSLVDLRALIQNKALIPYHEVTFQPISPEKAIELQNLTLGYPDDMLKSWVFCADEIHNLSEPEEIKGNISKQCVDDVLIFNFYKDGDFWFIGKDNQKPMSKLKGFEYIHFLLSHENKEFTALEIYYLGSVPNELMKSNSYTSTLDKLCDTDLSKAKILLQEQIATSEDTEKREELQEKLSQITDALQNKRRNLNRDNQQENNRTAIYNNLKNAIKKIHQDRPCLKDFITLKDTIFTGNTIKYKPDPLRPVNWQLFPQK
jgi:hypothetical protein